MIIDSHGHYTTVPSGMRVFRALQISNMGRPTKGAVSVSDDEIRSSLEKGQIRLLDERGIDVMLFSPMASAMGHHFGNARVSRFWTEVSNDLIHRACTLFPDRFVGVCALPQSPGVPPKECCEELERCVKEFGFIGCNLNPDPSGGYWTDPPLGDEWWYPLYEKLVELDATAMMHASATCNPAFHTTGSHYLNVDATAFMQLLESRVFTDFPTLKLVISHGGGNVPYQAARYRALCLMNKWEPFEQFIRRLYFDTTVYNLEAMHLLVTVAGVDNVMFASEMLGGVTTKDPMTGRMFDDNKPCIDALEWLTEDDRRKIFEGNVRRAYPRLNAALDRRAAASASR
ncbi:MAG TPA: amidohydrolase family protein [Vicinamibacterales bacterium]|jgi:4-oxalmesaconate hydratase|nr:amidohydrolase family protein [Vicinamibacterales bacterium]